MQVEEKERVYTIGSVHQMRLKHDIFCLHTYLVWIWALALGLDIFLQLHLTTATEQPIFV